MTSKRLIIEKDKQLRPASFHYTSVILASVTFFMVGYFSNALMSSISSTMIIPRQSTSSDLTVVKETNPPSITSVSTPITELKISAQLEHKYETTMTLYEKILRSCLGDYCFNARPDKSSRDRIGVLGPPGTGAELITSILENLAKIEHPKVESVEIVHSTNVPAYGYGKNHGWNRMIRVSRRILPQAYSLLIGKSEESPIDEKIFDAQVRQIVRWQCRLSHVAAHTRMLTVFTEDIMLRPHIEFEKMLSFVGLRVSQKVLESVLAEYLTKLEQGVLFFVRKT